MRAGGGVEGGRWRFEAGGGVRQGSCEAGGVVRQVEVCGRWKCAAGGGLGRGVVRQVEVGGRWRCVAGGLVLHVEV